MLTHIHLQNYRSFVNAEVDLAPFVLLVGANGAGKTNFFRAFVDCDPWIRSLHTGDAAPPTNPRIPRSFPPLQGHFNGGLVPPTIKLYEDTRTAETSCRLQTGPPPGSETIQIFNLNPAKISAPEPVVQSPFIAADGSGTTQLLESLKNGDQEALFTAAHEALTTYVPEIEKLSFATVQLGQKQMQVRERGVKQTVPADQLSDGTRLIIGLLAIIYQPIKPLVICLEDIDRGMHPRIFEQAVRLMKRITQEHGVQIIASTHNPYLVDCFHDTPEAVVIVEKKDAASTLSTLEQKLNGLDYDKVDPNEMPLGNLWFSGFVGGVPNFLRPAQK